MVCKKIYNGKFLLRLALIILLTSMPKLGVAMYFEAELGERQVLNISKEGINRITMMPHRIIQVTGDENKYILYTDTDGSNIYIVPICQVGDVIELSIKTSTNVTEDINLMVTDGTGQVIHLKRIKNADKGANIEIKKMIDTMQRSKIKKYFVRNMNRPINNKLGVDIKQTKSYGYGNLIGAVLEVDNLCDLSIELRERDFLNLFKNSKAVSFEGDQKILNTQSKVQVFVVSLVKDRFCNDR